jgi:prepilin-type N-terminal cleavage/methylation domain-containing protein
MKTAQKGFTLVEIAIVLVIIGLLLGGILKGQEMITQAKIKNVMADFSGISAAYHGYQDRYRMIPGDDNTAGARWTPADTATPKVIDGDGNGQVAGTYNAACPTVIVAASAESCKFWDHLRRSGFVSGSGGTQPFNSLTGMIGVQTGNGAAAAALGGFSGLIMCSANLPDKIAIAVDTQMDDGVPATGTVRGGAQAGPNPAVGAGVGTATVPDATYVENGTNTYTLCRSL